ncbi:sensor histidine kinase [Salinimicrobium soli]
MRSRQTNKILYFYLRENIKLIKEYIDHNSIRTTEKFRLTGKRFLKDVGIAAFASTTFFFIIVYMHQGELKLPGAYSLIELGLVFIFLLFLIWTHRWISILIHGDRMKRMHSLLRPIIEIAVVILATLILDLLLNYLPLKMIFPPEAFIPSRVRTSFVITTIISLFLYYFVERERSKKRLQAEILRSAQLQKENFQAQLENLKNQVNPHFLFNSLNVLVSLIPQDADRATKFTRKLSELYRSFLDNTSQQLIPLRKELEVAEAYIYLLKTRFGESVQFELEIAPEAMELHLPPGSLQVLLENAIKHNGSTRKKPLTIAIASHGNILEVKNNLQPRMEEVSSTNTGLTNITSRYSFLSDRKPEFKKTEDHFIAELPLLKVEIHENPHY